MVVHFVRPEETGVTVATTRLALVLALVLSGSSFALGGAPFKGSMGGTTLNGPIVGIASPG
jgi:hypothetical protein